MREGILKEMIFEPKLKAKYMLAEQKLEGTVFCRKEMKFAKFLRSKAVENLKEKKNIWCSMMSGEQRVRDEIVEKIEGKF